MSPFGKGDAPRNGDRVRVQGRAFEGILQEWDGTVGTVAEDDGKSRSFKVPFCTVEVLERSDDPSKDPAGTVRREEHGDFINDPPGFSVWQATVDRGGRWRWLCTYSTARGNRGEYLDHEDVVGMPIIGSAPGTPAAEAEANEGLREPRLFEPYGPEPPEDDAHAGLVEVLS